MRDFFAQHEQFMIVKKLEGHAEKTLQDHVTFMRYVQEWMKSEVKDYENRFVEKGLFLEYVAYMFGKDYKPCTINVRLRTLKCYLWWLCSEKLIPDDITSKIKLVKSAEGYKGTFDTSGDKTHV